MDKTPNIPKLGPSPVAKRRRTSKRRRNGVEVENGLHPDEPVASNSSSGSVGEGPLLDRTVRRANGGRLEDVEERVEPQHQNLLVMEGPAPCPLAIMPASSSSSGSRESQRAVSSSSALELPQRSRNFKESPGRLAGLASVALQARAELSAPIPMDMAVEQMNAGLGQQLQDVNLEPIDEEAVEVDVPATQPLHVQTLLNPQQSRVDDHGWQESRLLLTERSSFLLNNPRMSDIRFLVGDTHVEVFGHKTILAMGSPVFEAQFFGSLKSDVDTIDLPDLEPDTFLLFLKYLYTDTLDESIDDMKVLQLLRPAKKYIVPHLIEKCSDILMSELRAENVFQVYNYAVFFDLKKLEGACLRFIDRECEAIIQTEEFTMLNSQTLANFLKRDGLNIKEDVLFNAVLRWAELECERMSIEPTDLNIRAALDENLRLIRFPTMSSEEFATEVASRNILTAEESRSIFIYMCSCHPNRLSPALTPDFPVKKRGFYPQQYLVSRFSGEPQSHSLNYRSGEIYTYRINFKADRQIFFKGVNIFSIKCGMNAQYVDQRRFNGAVYLFECDAVVGDRDERREKGRKQFTRESSLESEHETSSGSRYFPVLFDQEVRIPANVLFTVSAVVSVASSSYNQQPLLTCMGTDEITTAVVKCAEDLHVNFTFSNCFGEASVGKYTQSQIPEILFSL